MPHIGREQMPHVGRDQMPHFGRDQMPHIGRDQRPRPRSVGRLEFRYREIFSSADAWWLIKSLPAPALRKPSGIPISGIFLVGKHVVTHQISSPASAPYAAWNSDIGNFPRRGARGDVWRPRARSASCVSALSFCYVLHRARAPTTLLTVSARSARLREHCSPFRLAPLAFVNITHRFGSLHSLQ